MIPPQYNITTPIGEECRNLNYFTNLNIEREYAYRGLCLKSTIPHNKWQSNELILIKLKDNSTSFSIPNQTG